MLTELTSFYKRLFFKRPGILVGHVFTGEIYFAPFALSPPLVVIEYFEKIALCEEGEALELGEFHFIWQVAIVPHVLECASELDHFLGG
jgi:hypothetical protein